MRAVRRLTTLPLAVLALLACAPAALAHDQGQGWYGLTTDKTVTNAGFVLIIAFPLIVFGLSKLQGHLERRKDERKRAAKARAGNRQWQGGW